MLVNLSFISTEVIDQIERNSKGPLPFVRVTRDRIAARRMLPFWGDHGCKHFRLLAVATVPEPVSEVCYQLHCIVFILTVMPRQTEKKKKNKKVKNRNAVQVSSCKRLCE